MNRSEHWALAIASISLGLVAAAPAKAASLASVDRSTWGASGVPSYVSMYIYVPDSLATNPPVVVACHSCGTPVSGYFNSVQGIRAAADANGFIIVFPEATGQNCWDVGSTQSLSHDGGGDTQAVAQMVEYTLSQYNGDADRVYVMGGSSGGMMTQAMVAVYPNLFQAGSARAGVPAGCWADGYDSSNQWSGNCAGGRTTKTAQQWGDLVRGMYPGYDGHRPRVQLVQGTQDATISYNNMGEAIKEWTNVLGLDTTPTRTDSITTSVDTYDREYWDNECYTVLEAWSGRTGGHSMAYEEDAILEFFGLDVAGGIDPEAEACSQGTGGTGGSGGAPTGGAPTGGVDNTGGIVTGGAPLTGGAGPTGGESSDTGGTPPTGGASPTGGAPTGGLPPVTGGAPTGGVSTGGMSNGGIATGGMGANPMPTGGMGATGFTGGTAAVGQGASSGGSIDNPSPADEEGCSCRVAASHGRRGPLGAALALLAGIALCARRWRRG